MTMITNAQTCEIGLSDITPVYNSLGSNTWGTGTQNIIYGVQRTVNKNGNLTKIGVICGGTASNFKGGIYSDNSNNPDQLLQMTGIHNPSGSTVDTFLVSLNDTISVTAGEKFWVCVNFENTHNRNILNNGMNSQSGYSRFSVGNNYANTQFPNLDPCPSGPPCSSVQTGQYAFFLVIEDCTDPMPITVQNGDADDPATWQGGILPTDGDSVIVQNEVNWNLDMETDGDTYAWLLVKDSLTMASGSSIQTNVLVDSLGNSFAEKVRVTNPTGNVSITGSGTSYFDDLLIEGDSLFFEKSVEIFNLELESDCHVVTTNLSMEGKLDIPSEIYWDDAVVDVTFSGNVSIVDRFTIIDPPGSTYGTWRIEGGPGIGNTIGDWDTSPNHISNLYSESDNPSYNLMSPAIYEETNTSINKDIGWVSPTGDAHSLDSIGFFAYYNAGTYETSWDPTLVTDTFTFSGLTNTSSGNASADGWVLLRNPFACAVDFEDFTLSGMEESCWTWDHLAVQYGEYNRNTNAGTNGQTSEIAAGQAFWVKVLSGQTGSVSIPPSAMVKTDDLEYRDDELTPIELILTSNTDNSIWANAFIIPMENGALEYTSEDVLTFNNNSLLGNMTICTTSSDGEYLSQNIVPNNQEMIIDIWGSSSSDFWGEMLTINLGPEYENWCIKLDWVGAGYENEEWLSVVSGEELFVLVSIPQNTQVNFARIKLESPVSLAIVADSNVVSWAPGSDWVPVSITAEGNWTSPLEWSWTNNSIVMEGTPNDTGLDLLINGQYPDDGLSTSVYATTTFCGSNITDSITVNIDCVPMTLELESYYIEEVLPESGEPIFVTINLTSSGLYNILWYVEGWGDQYGGSYEGFVELWMGTPGVYPATATGYNTCGEEIVVSFTISLTGGAPSSVVETNLGDFTIFPNPSNGEDISITSPGGEVMIYNSAGSLVERQTIQSGNRKLILNQTLASGVYTVRFSNQYGTDVERLVVR